MNENPVIVTSDGNDVIADNGFDAPEAVVPAGSEWNGASVDVAYAGLIARVYNHLVEVSSTLDAENVIVERPKRKNPEKRIIMSA